MITTLIEEITPKMAKAYLEHNDVNRKIKPCQLRAYASDMASGRWELNGEAIRFNEDGKLIDGQHRLTAIIKAGVPVKMVVMRGLSNDITVCDLGVKRSMADSLIIDGVERGLVSNCVISMIRLIYDIENPHFKGVISKAEIKNFIDRHKDTLDFLWEICWKRGQENKVTGFKAAHFTAPLFFALESGVDRETIKEFSEIVASGFYSDPSQTAAIVCRNDMMDFHSKGSYYRRICSFSVEKAIYDFVNKTQRRKSYKSWQTPIYSCNEKFRRELKLFS